MIRRLFRGAILTGAALLLVGCSSIVEVDNPGVIEAPELDQIADARILSLSARQDFTFVYGRLIVFGAWFTGEAISAETFLSVSEFDRRDVTPDNADLLFLWSSLSIARASAERVVRALSETISSSPTIDLARAALFAGYSYAFMAESFCAGAADGGPLLDRASMLQRAVEHFTTAESAAARAMTEGLAANRTEASEIRLAALVGRARSHLQGGQKASAAADASQVPPGFSYSLWYSDDPANRARLGNWVWQLTGVRGALSIAPAFRNLGDPRVSVAPPAPEFRSVDGLTPLWTQRKYTSHAASIRLASGLEAQYIAAEARGTDAMLALIQARRAANGLAMYTGSMENGAVLSELMLQRARDFFLEGKRTGDISRNPGLVPDVRPSRSQYHKVGFAPVGTQTCWPSPTKETARFGE